MFSVCCCLLLSVLFGVEDLGCAPSEIETQNLKSRIHIQGSPSGGKRMPPGGDASRKALRFNQKKMGKQAIKRPHTEA